jgi:RepB plasmid partitioning protein/ParB-like nuclease domain
MTSTATRSAFRQHVVTLPMSRIIPQREPSGAANQKSCYDQIASSLKNVGLIEPLVVYEQPDGNYLLVDGNTRFDILKSLGATEVPCIFAKDDEAYTYNRRVSHVPPIQQHFMLLRVLASGVSEERVAAALNVDVKAVRRKKDLLTGICPEAVTLLEGRRLSERSFLLLRKMKPLRQIEAVDHMIVSNIFTNAFLGAILAVTKPQMLVTSPEGRNGRIQGTTTLQREHEGLVRNLKTIETSYGLDMLTLAVSLKYVERVVMNIVVTAYLHQKHPETLVILSRIVHENAPGEHNAERSHP